MSSQGERYTKTRVAGPRERLADTETELASEGGLVEGEYPIWFDSSGYLLCYASQSGDLYGDTWHETLEDAEEAATAWFGVRPDQWQNAGYQLEG